MGVKDELFSFVPMHEGAKVQFSSQAAAEQFCFPAETGKLSLKLTGS